MPHVDGIDDGVGYGVFGKSPGGNGVYGLSQVMDGYGLYGERGMYYAAILNGKVRITGNLEKAGGSFKIDHPLDPANKYLCHSFVESPDMKNVYDGVVVLDDKGEAEIELPDWFGILNKDFRILVMDSTEPMTAKVIKILLIFSCNLKRRKRKNLTRDMKK
jgi:hypothetical protein